jgi:glycosyltransferase involved in cell wall biosynthesis
VEGTAPLRILGETAYPLAVASARVRVASFEPFLRSHDVALKYHPTLTDSEYGILASRASIARKAIALAKGASRATLRHRAHDLLLVHRLRLLIPLPGIDPPPRLDVYDIDDALFLGSAAPANLRFQWAKQEARRCIECLRRARLVIAGNSFLAGEARGYARRVEVVPSCVDPGGQDLRTHGPADVVTVGWIGSHTTSAYLQPVLPVFAHLNKDRVRAKLVLIGADPRLRASWIEHRPWSLARETTDLAGFDIGIMPLPDTDWARGKCGYKVLQYFSAGVPAVASPVGVTSELIGRDRGILAASPEEWRAALERLIDDVAERRERGAAGRAFVEREYSYQRWAPELAAMLHSVAG